MDRFAQILYDLGKEIGIDLFPDQHRLCQINYHNELHIQLQYDETKQLLLMATFICDVPPGKYREKLLKACLISNGEYPRTGTLAYSEKNNKLTLFESISTQNMQANALVKILAIFIEKAKSWKHAVENGTPLPVSLVGKKGKVEEEGKNLFGLKP